MNKTEILTNFESLSAEVLRTAEQIADEVFFHKESDAQWSPAEILQHTALTLVPVAGSLRSPRFMERRWGRAERPSRSREVFLADYKAATSKQAWKTIQPFIPGREGQAADYWKLHAAEDPAVLENFVALTGERVHEISRTNRWNAATRQSDVIDYFSQQSAALVAGLGKLSEEQLDGLLMPLPYVGLITVREIIYFTLMHTRHHLIQLEERASVVGSSHK